LQGEDVLDRDWYACQDAGVFTSGDLAIHFVRLPVGKVFGQADKGVYFLLFSGVELLFVKPAWLAVNSADLRQGSFQDFASAQLAGAHVGSDFQSGKLVQAHFAPFTSGTANMPASVSGAPAKISLGVGKGCQTSARGPEP